MVLKMQSNEYGKRSHRFLLSSVLTMIMLVPNLFAQRQLLENFESDLDQWTIINGDVSTSEDQAQAGQSALRMRANSAADNISIIEFNELDDNFGSYEVYFYCTGNSSVADFLFQYVDNTNFFRVSCRPIGTTNSGISMSQSTSTGENVLATEAANFGLNEWHQLRIDRYCDGHIHIDMNGSRILTLDIFQDYHRGKVQLQSRSSDTYFDDLSFRPFQPPPLVARIDTTCAGVPVLIGDALRYTSGTYSEVTSVIEGNCVAEQEVQLHVIEVDTLYESHTLCLGDTAFLYDRQFTKAGHYQVIAPVQEGCGALTEIEIEHHPRSATTDSFAFCPVPGNQISPGAFASYTWENGSTAAQLMPPEEGIYQVVTTDEFACPYNLDLIVTDNCPITTWLPNAFTPNGDGNNDYLTSVHNKAIDLFHLSVFDRWGNQVFETKNQQGWDGKIGSTDAQEGIYLYLLKINADIESGDVMLIR